MKVILLMVMCCSIFSGCKSGPMIIAHRGNSSYAPENTMASVQSGWIVDADAVEVDVYLTSDGKIAVIHDGDTQRVSGEKLVVTESSYEQLSKLDVGSHKSWYFKNERIPLLEDVIASIPAGRKLFVEVKSSPQIVPYLKELFNNSPNRDRLVVIAFNKDVLDEVKKQIPDIPAYWLIGASKDSETGEILPYDTSLIDTALHAGFEGLNVNYGGLNEEFVALAHARGLEVYVWTVNYFEDAQRLRQYGVDGITTDRPADLSLLLKN
ncbi:Glycerophosphoryl diester phosphodiesterase [Limihaloglobus sulfuriphilus]|uniref:Glycerophosphoryl diester phosphodiesterase n=1 Tax=Limihaloglobus sulfuriphilus TaxID=1851148 RepID=A0A1Q2MB55_9BACT|nr:glycerophosphodiester phosphodiesterase family protein [Limihaloglobus sulfuriphilus]AQQ69890.1 Glycerophosphoryl diester phosphodiesterase [Limihaloglobus sulfuriphilus]